MSLFDHRDAFSDHADIGSTLAFEYMVASSNPLITIAIPTFRRHGLLMEAVASALAQSRYADYEIVIVDNDPDADEQTLVAIQDCITQYPNIAIRYYINKANLGMFGNWNRCIELANGRWVTILNDDDVLRPDFLRKTTDAISRNPLIDAIVCRKGTYDRRKSHNADRHSHVSDLLKKAFTRLRFGLGGSRRVTPRSFFFGNEIGNGLGFLFKRQVAIDIGGYKPERFPAADVYFYLQISVNFHFIWLWDVLADVGVGDNESMRRENLEQWVRQGVDIRNQLREGYIPLLWWKMNDQLTANTIFDAKKIWDVDLNAQVFEEEFKKKLPPPNYKRVRLFRIVHAAF